jgi:hypothetical protein
MATKNKPPSKKGGKAVSTVAVSTVLIKHKPAAKKGSSKTPVAYVSVGGNRPSKGRGGK